MLDCAWLGLGWVIFGYVYIYIFVYVYGCVVIWLVGSFVVNGEICDQIDVFCLISNAESSVIDPR